MQNGITLTKTAKSIALTTLKMKIM